MCDWVFFGHLHVSTYYNELDTVSTAEIYDYNKHEMPVVHYSLYHKSNIRLTSYSLVSALRSNSHVIVFRSQNIFSKIERSPAKIIYQITRQNEVSPGHNLLIENIRAKQT